MHPHCCLDEFDRNFEPIYFDLQDDFSINDIKKGLDMNIDHFILIIKYIFLHVWLYFKCV